MIAFLVVCAHFVDITVNESFAAKKKLLVTEYTIYTPPRPAILARRNVRRAETDALRATLDVPPKRAHRCWPG